MKFFWRLYACLAAFKVCLLQQHRSTHSAAPPAYIFDVIWFDMVLYLQILGYYRLLKRWKHEHVSDNHLLRIDWSGYNTSTQRIWWTRQTPSRKMPSMTLRGTTEPTRGYPIRISSVLRPMTSSWSPVTIAKTAQVERSTRSLRGSRPALTHGFILAIWVLLQLYPMRVSIQQSKWSFTMIFLLSLSMRYNIAYTDRVTSCSNMHQWPSRSLCACYNASNSTVFGYPQYSLKTRANFRYFWILARCSLHIGYSI